jgi:hypothetical protein
MALILRQAFTSGAIPPLTIPCPGQSYVGINIAGNGGGSTFAFNCSSDGQTFGPNFPPAGVQPYPSGTPVTAVNVNGTWWVPVQTIYSVQVSISTYVSGSPTVILSTSQDNSFLAGLLNPNQIFLQGTSTANAAQTVTQAANANHAWNLKSLAVTFSGGTPSGNVQIKDGSTILAQYDLAASAAPTSVGAGIIVIPLPMPSTSNPNGGITGSINTALNIVVSALGTGVISNVDAEVYPA